MGKDSFTDDLLDELLTSVKNNSAFYLGTNEDDCAQYVMKVNNSGIKIILCRTPEYESIIVRKWQ